MLAPVSHFFYSHRLRLQFWDWGGEGKPALLLVEMYHVRSLSEKNGTLLRDDNADDLAAVTKTPASGDAGS